MKRRDESRLALLLVLGLGGLASSGCNPPWLGNLGASALPGVASAVAAGGAGATPVNRGATPPIDGRVSVLPVQKKDPREKQPAGLDTSIEDRRNAILLAGMKRSAAEREGLNEDSAVRAEQAQLRPGSPAVGGPSGLIPMEEQSNLDRLVRAQQLEAGKAQRFPPDAVGQAILANPVSVPPAWGAQGIGTIVPELTIRKDDTPSAPPSLREGEIKNAADTDEALRGIFG